METIRAEMRKTGTKARHLRRNGKIPCVISGASLKESLSIQIEDSTARKIQRTMRDGSKCNIQVGDKVYHTLIKDLDYDILNNATVHISFQILDPNKVTNSVADIVILNRDKVANLLEIMQTKIPHAAKPDDLLDLVAVDMDGLSAGTVITVADIPEFQNDKIELQVDPETIVLRIKEMKSAIAEPVEEIA